MKHWKSVLIPHLIALGVFFVIAFIFTAPAFSGKKIAAHDTQQFKGLVKEIADHREAYDEEPLWTNSVFGGMPATQISIIYAKNLIKSIDTIPYHLGIPRSAVRILKYLIGAYILFLALKIPWKLSIAGAIALALSSYFLIIIQAGHNTKANAIAYVAPTLAGIILTYRGKYLLGGALTALFFALNLVANHVQITYYMGLSLLILGAVEAVKAIRTKSIKPFVFSTLVVFGAVGLALGVNNTNLRMTADYVKDTQRGKSELAIKQRQAEQKAKKAEEARLQAIKEAKERKKNDKNYEFDEANFLPPDKAYATRWSYGKIETFTLLAANASGGGSADDYSYIIDDSEVVDQMKKSFVSRGASRRQAEKEAEKQFSSVSPAFYWGDQPGVNGPVYIGGGLIFLFVLALFTVKSRLKWWLLGTAVLGILIAWGKNFLPFFNLMWDYFPGYNKFRAITMALFLTEIAVPVLGFIFLKELVKGELDKAHVFKMLKIVGGVFLGLLFFLYVSPKSFFDFEGAVDGRLPESLLDAVQADRVLLFKKDVLITIGSVLVFAAVVFAIVKEKAKMSVLATVLGIAIFGDLYIVDNRYFNESMFEREKSVLVPFEKTNATQDLEANHPGNYRVYNASRGSNGAINDASTAYYHRDIGGYSSVKLMIYQDILDFNLGSEMSQVDQELQRLTRSGNFSPQYFQQTFANKNVMNMLNTKYIIVNPQAPAIENPYAFGSAWCVDRVVHYDEPDSVLFKLQDFNLKKTAVLFGEKDNVKFGGTGKVELVKDRSNLMEYQFSSESNEFVVFSEVYYKYWKAYIDGKPADLKRTNYILRGVEVPAGQHKIELRYEPDVFYQGESISLVCSSLLLLLFGFAVFKEFKKKNEVLLKSEHE